MNELSRRERERQNMVKTIISTAEELFCKLGYENTAMDDIAKASEYTKRTIYKYFRSKEDLFFAVALKGYQELYRLIVKNNNEEVNGFGRIRSAYYAFYEFYKRSPQMLQLINLSGVVKSASPNPESPYMLKYMKIDKELFDIILKMFMEGKADGSIRTDMEISMLAFSSIFMVTGYFQMLSLSGDTYTSHFGIDKELFIRHSIEIMLGTIEKREGEGS